MGVTDSNLGDMSTTSFFPAKPLGCYGDGGAVFTNNDDYAGKVKMLRVHGQNERYFHKYRGKWPYGYNPVDGSNWNSAGAAAG